MWRDAADRQADAIAHHARIHRIQGWSYDDIGRAVRDLIESHEVFSFNIELASGEGSFSDFAWIERRHAAAVARLDANTDPVMVYGLRKIVRKWGEELARSRAELGAMAQAEKGDRAGAHAVIEEFNAWMDRPDRKRFDMTSIEDPIYRC